MNLIDRDKLIEEINYDPRLLELGMESENVIEVIKEQPTVNEWIPVSERLPEDETQYLCAIQPFVGNDIYYGVRRYAKDLFKVDEYDFNHKQGVSGFYNYDSEYGYVSESAVIAWMPIPEYKGDKE